MLADCVGSRGRLRFCTFRRAEVETRDTDGNSEIFALFFYRTGRMDITGIFAGCFIIFVLFVAR